MSENNWTLMNAFKYVQSKRSIAYPNYNFQKQLKRLELNLGLISQEEFEKETKNRMCFLDDI